MKCMANYLTWKMFLLKPNKKLFNTANIIVK